MTFKIITLGCKVNTYESEVMKEKLLKAGYKESEDISDIVIINTCSVTNMADSKSRKLIRREKKENEGAIICACGCCCENHREELLDIGIDILIGNNEKSKIVNLIEDYIKSGVSYVKFYDTKRLPFEDMAVEKFTSHTRGFIKIQDGCNNYCSYCIIPYMRGNIRSKDINVALEECRNLVKNGHKEIVLTGIHTGSYGREKDYDLVDLINKMSLIEGLDRIRISSIEVTELNDKFMDMLRSNNKVCNHLHIPLQAGTDKILKLMNRKYNKEEFKNQIDKIRSIRPDISISTDVIVGFPGESEEDFIESMEFCKEINFSKIHVFPFSLRSGTKAEELPDHLDNSIKKERARRLISVSEELEYNYNNLFKDKVVNVLIEEVKDGVSSGHTSNYLKVNIKDEVKPNTFVDCIIDEIHNEYVVGHIKK